MTWLAVVSTLIELGSIKLQVSFAEYSLFYRALLQKRPIVFSLLSVHWSDLMLTCHNSCIRVKELPLLGAAPLSKEFVSLVRSSCRAIVCRRKECTYNGEALTFNFQECTSNGEARTAKNVLTMARHELPTVNSEQLVPRHCKYTLFCDIWHDSALVT